MYKMDIEDHAIELNIHALGVSYIYGYLDREGYTIFEVHSDPLHHFQILAKRENDLIIVAVRTAYHPDFGAIDTPIQQQLIKESKRLNAIPHVACLAVSPLETNDLEIEGLPEGTDYHVTFNGLTTL